MLLAQGNNLGHITFYQFHYDTNIAKLSKKRIAGTDFLGSVLLKPAGDGKVHLLFAAYYAHLLFRSLYQTIKYRTAILDKI